MPFCAFPTKTFSPNKGAKYLCFPLPMRRLLLP